MTDTSDAIVIDRTFDAPADLIWQMWTDPEHFAQWYGPDGAVIAVAELDVRVGGIRRVCMEVQTPKGVLRMWFTGEYREIVEPTRLVYTESITDELGNVMPAGDGSTGQGHPTSTEVRVELEDLGGQTRMVMRHLGVPAASPGAAGWEMAFDKLAARVRVLSHR